MTDKPLKILVLDGGGLQAISTLLILDDLLKAIAKQRGISDRKPKPCEIFDTIAGIGAGGWLAILLGRFRMDVLAAMTEWYHLMRPIAPRSKTEELRMRVRHHCHFDMDTLVSQVDKMTHTYRTGETLFEPKPEGARTRHVIVAALRHDDKAYSLFRSYPIPPDAKLPNKLLDGPENPSEFKISSAFGVTGAARYFSPVWKEHLSSGSRAKFSDTRFPKPHNITELIIDEMWGIYGQKKDISVIVNIGPGQPIEKDIDRIIKRFSWGLSPLDIDKKAAQAAAQSWDKQPKPHAFSTVPTTPEHQDEKKHQEPKHISFGHHRIQLPNLHHHYHHQEPTTNTNRPRMRSRTTFGSIRGETLHQKMKRLEQDIEIEINTKLKLAYGHGHDGGDDNNNNNKEQQQQQQQQLYFRLAIEQAPEGSPQNDSNASGVVYDTTMGYLSKGSTERTIHQVVQRLPEVMVHA